MATCSEMEKGDLFVCETCGLELRVEKACSCKQGEAPCRTPLECCDKQMIKQ